MTNKVPPLLAGEIVTATGYPAMVVAAVNPATGMAWLTCREGNE